MAAASLFPGLASAASRAVAVVPMLDPRVRGYARSRLITPIPEGDSRKHAVSEETTAINKKAVNQEIFLINFCLNICRVSLTFSETSRCTWHHFCVRCIAIISSWDNRCKKSKCQCQWTVSFIPVTFFKSICTNLSCKTWKFVIRIQFQRSSYYLESLHFMRIRSNKKKKHSSERKVVRSLLSYENYFPKGLKGTIWTIQSIWLILHLRKIDRNLKWCVHGT